MKNELIGDFFGTISLLGIITSFILLYNSINWINLILAVIGFLFSIKNKSTNGCIVSVVSIIVCVFLLIFWGSYNQIELNIK